MQIPLNAADVSLLISTYNWPAALRLCLLSVERLHPLPGEVLIADDGSGSDTADLIAAFQARFPVPLRHIWQPDEGFQLARIRNKAIAAAKGRYIIQVDGDQLLHPRFVADHLRLARSHCFITGSRVLLNPAFSARLQQQQSIPHKTVLMQRKHFFNSLHIPMLQAYLSTRYKVHGSHRYHVKGSNMSFWKEDLIRVNGYNEAFTGWGKEDTEIAIRLLNAGVKKLSLKMGGICYHLHHPEASRVQEAANLRLMEDAIAAEVSWCAKGLHQYLSVANASTGPSLPV